MRNFLIKLISTFFYAGYLPLAPGTFGSIIGIFIFLLIKDNFFTYIIITLLFITLGFLITAEAERLFNKKDAKCIVLDEISGMLLSLMFIPYEIKLLVIAFIIFRLLDALKPYPADRFQNFRGGIGIMSDDLVAGLYTNIILQFVLRCISFKGS